jgi:hypothetical protein
MQRTEGLQRVSRCSALVHVQDNPPFRAQHTPAHTHDWLSMISSSAAGFCMSSHTVCGCASTALPTANPAMTMSAMDISGSAALPPSSFDQYSVR